MVGRYRVYVEIASRRDHKYVFVVAVIIVAAIIIFDYTNGFHDASSIVATIIASRAMTPFQAVMLTALFEFLGPLFGGTAVANTIGNFVVIGDLPELPAMIIILCGIAGAIAWNILTWWFGIPSSSSHALVGGLVGVARTCWPAATLRLMHAA